ncbi:N-acetylmuramoyl-L-alanine amidase family protein [Paucihalobacter sp.]|uniref:N-acetylmuramoyl-L-alanine amidase family protein n=1 Tax=Paucihalobacter sp. TaxID=2850405 RepID=UPI002FDFC216
MKTSNKPFVVLWVFAFTFFLTTSIDAQNSQAPFIVVLDAGHGGHDPGNLGSPGSGYKEKDIALNVTLLLGKALEKNPNIKVIYTRTTDVFLKLHERANIANKADADLFVSIHCNSHHSSAHGTETFVLGIANNERNFDVAKKENQVIFLEEDYESHYDGFNPNNPESTIGLALMQEEYMDQSVLLARLIEDNFSQKLKRNSRGIKQASLWVMHNTYMPSVLVELGFLTAKSEGAYLNSKKGQSEMAKALETALLEYKKTLDINVGTNISNSIQKAKEVTKERIAANSGIEFKVQIAASSKNLDIKPYNFKGLDKISKDKIGNLYKYYYGTAIEHSDAEKLLKIAHSKGYKSAFIVAFKDGNQMSLDEALKSTLN